MKTNVISRLSIPLPSAIQCRMRRSAPALCASLLLPTACVAPSAPPPAPVMAQAPPPSPSQPAPSRPADWRDWDTTPGDWSYRQDANGSLASFGRPQANPDFSIRCDRTSRRISLSRAANAGTAGQMRVRTSFGDASWPVQTSAGATAYTTALLDAADPILDRMAFSRGRFVVEVSSQPYLALPPWPEFIRVIEDCRG